MSIIQLISRSGSNKKIKPKKHEPELARSLGRVGVLTRNPTLWAGVAAAMGASSDAKLRRAAGRATACYISGAVIGNLPKPLFGRPQPRFRRAKKPEIIRGSFPSGHGAAEVGYVFGATLEAPILFLPLGTAAVLAHWSLVRAGKHYLSDLLVGGTMGLAIALMSKRAWPMDKDALSRPKPG
ncbi:MAG: phosphatase PAP2 family protein [Actinobacteria bacterium]|nr:phosphatase PAP2 family protein [Actinomycetota bacterium]